MKNISLGNVLILGDSYSSFRGYIPENYQTYYSMENGRMLMFGVLKKCGGISSFKKQTPIWCSMIAGQRQRSAIPVMMALMRPIRLFVVLKDW